MMGAQHAAILAASAAADLLVCCDTDPKATRHVPSGSTFTTSIEEALDAPGLEAVFIATPQNHHLTAVRAAVDRGLAVFCEKPVADSLAGADAIAAEALRSERPLVIGHMFRFESRYGEFVPRSRTGAWAGWSTSPSEASPPTSKGALWLVGHRWLSRMQSTAWTSCDGWPGTSIRSMPRQAVRVSPARDCRTRSWRPCGSHRVP